MKLCIENKIRIIAGSFVFISALLAYFHHKYWLFFTMFVGVNLLQFGFTNFCPLKIILEKLEK
ncbi:MAG: DUF2892 domain-containing protein [Nanoarchaeota archaeon]|nr:DUF2892 domain-containing protein [Nanoarchaeota archaeon]